MAVVTKEKPRSVGRWYIGETLGKGGYSWVKKGFDKRTSRCVALKFMAKADSSWAEEQTKQVITEIESLKQIRHHNVMKLYAYNLNARYPTKEGTKLDCILLVLEYAPGGELFDILYYTSALEQIVARTYFRQFMSGLHACHSAGVAHRDLKPQNLLLDSKFNLKITDFGLSKVFESDNDTIMKTTYVGTRGYQAPELLLNKNYDIACDVFSAGVVLFILLTGYPPFEQAVKSDRWFRPLVKGKHKAFWDLHQGCPISENEKCKDLLQRMLCFDPKRRITIGEIRKHPWFNDKYLEGKDLIKVLRNKHRQMESKRKRDARKLKDLQHSITTRDIPGIENLKDCPEFPGNEIEGIYDTHTNGVSWKQIYNTIHDVIAEIGGQAEFDMGERVLTCALKYSSSSSSTNSLIRFDVRVYRSREFVKAVEEESDNEYNSDDEFDPEDKTIVYVVRIRRLEGDVLTWRRIKAQVLFAKCAAVLNGLPGWAKEELKNKESPGIPNEKVEEDDYDAELASTGSFNLVA